MSYGRQWLEDVGSDDSTGRTIWALGTCIGRSADANTVAWAMNMLEHVLPTVASMSSPRAWAFSLLGIYEYQKKFNDDRLAKTIQRQLLDKLMFRYTETATEDWPWFENTLSYDNAMLAHALLRSGDERLVQTGLTSLRWLVKPANVALRPLPAHWVEWFLHKGLPRAYFDQQPLEAQRRYRPAWRPSR